MPAGGSEWGMRTQRLCRVSTKRGDLASSRRYQEGLLASLSFCRPQPEHNPSLMLFLGLKEKQQFSLYRSLFLEKMYELCVVSS